MRTSAEYLPQPRTRGLWTYCKERMNTKRESHVESQQLKELYNNESTAKGTHHTGNQHLKGVIYSQQQTEWRANS